MGKPKPIVWEGVTYPSINACARATGMHPITLRKYRAAGITRAADIPPTPSPPGASHQWGDERLTVAEIAEREGVARRTAYQWIERGHTSRPERVVSGKPCMFRGGWYATMQQAADAYGISRQAVWSELQRKAAKNE